MRDALFPGPQLPVSPHLSLSTRLFLSVACSLLSMLHAGVVLFKAACDMTVCLFVPVPSHGAFAGWHSMGQKGWTLTLPPSKQCNAAERSLKMCSCLACVKPPEHKVCVFMGVMSAPNCKY